MNILTVRGKMLARDIVSFICYVLIVVSVAFSPLIYVSENVDDFFGHEVKAVAELNLIQWLNGGEVDYYLIYGDSEDEKVKAGTIDIVKDLKDPELIYENNMLTESELEMKKIGVETAQKMSFKFFVSVGFAFFMVMCVAVTLKTKKYEKKLKALIEKGASVEEIEKAKNNVFYLKHFIGTPQNSVSYILILSFTICYIWVGIKEENPLESITYGVNWLGCVLPGVIVVISYILDMVISSVIVREVETKHINDSEIVKKMPCFVSSVVNDQTVQRYTNDTHSSAGVYDASNNKAIDNVRTLSEYKKLLDDGAITKEEYEKLKAMTLFRE